MMSDSTCGGGGGGSALSSSLSQPRNYGVKCILDGRPSSSSGDPVVLLCM